LADSNQLDPATAKARGKPAEWAVAALALLANGQNETAIKLALKVSKQAADDPEAAMLAAEVLSAEVPDWHFRLVQDHLRNEAYDAALRRAIRPGMRVLDIGSGTGLLAMMAARAGAAEVFSCEMNPAVADVAQEIIAVNGLSDRVQVLSKHSGKLDADVDLGGRVDIIVSEIVSNNMLSEGVLPSMEHATGNLLKPGGVVIPARGTVKVALAFHPHPSDKRMEITDGFDLTPFNRLAAPIYHVSSRDTNLQLASEAADLFEFDFRAANPVAKARTEQILTAYSGPANCVAQWIRLEMDEAGSYENRPGEPAYSHWTVIVYPLPKQAVLHPGESIRVCGSHDKCNVRIWAAAV